MFSTDSTKRFFGSKLGWPVLLLFLALHSFAQTYRAQLPIPATTDPPGGHISILSTHPAYNYQLPSVPLNEARFFTLIGGIMVIPKGDREELYIDRNNNGDLTDDGEPLSFLYSASEMVVQLPNGTHFHDSLFYVIQRKPYEPDSILHPMLDREGNLVSVVAKFWARMLSDTAFNGHRGTFYFTHALDLRRGTIGIDGKMVDIGVALRGEESSFGDSKNILLVDRNGDHILNPEDVTEVCKLNDVFTLFGKNYKVAELDARGAWLELERTTAMPTLHYAKEHRRQIDQATTDVGSTVEVDSTLWSLILTSLDGDTIRLRDYRGSYLLLDFWGEWCKPCVEEIPDLVQAYSRFAQRPLRIVGFIRLKSLTLARHMIKEKNIAWPQVPLTDQLANYFQVQTYPTYVLILPDGRTSIRMALVNIRFLTKHLR